jgi:hypothetical protein
MNRARAEMNAIASALDLQAEAWEREAARQRQKPEIEFEAITLRSEAAQVRRIDR